MMGDAKWAAGWLLLTGFAGGAFVVEAWRRANAHGGRGDGGNQRLATRELLDGREKQVVENRSSADRRRRKLGFRAISIPHGGPGVVKTESKEVAGSVTLHTVFTRDAADHTKWLRSKGNNNIPEDAKGDGTRENRPTVRRDVHVADAFDFMASVADGGLPGHVVTSLPDISELNTDGIHTRSEYGRWFVDTSREIFRKLRGGSVCILYQTDTLLDNGTWLSKAHLAVEAAGDETLGMHMVWHKVCCVTQPGSSRRGRPGYSHMMCFYKQPAGDTLKNFHGRAMLGQPDVLPDRGEMAWARGMGRNSCQLAIEYIAMMHEDAATSSAVPQDFSELVIVDPFCGMGSVMATANNFGFDAVGVERSLKRCKRASRLTF